MKNKDSKFETQRLICRKMQSGDFDVFYNLYSDLDVMRYAYLDAFKSKKEVKKTFKETLKKQNDMSKGTEYIVYEKLGGDIIGIADYEVCVNHKMGGIYEIGYFLFKPCWGNGYACEISDALIDYLFSEMNAHKVEASCNAENIASENIMIKLGMTKESTCREGRYKNDKWVDELRYSILRSEWESKN